MLKNNSYVVGTKPKSSSNLIELKTTSGSYVFGFCVAITLICGGLHNCIAIFNAFYSNRTKTSFACVVCCKCFLLLSFILTEMFFSVCVISSVFKHDISF